MHRHFHQLQIGQLSISTVVYVGIGVLVYALVVRFSKRPARIYTIIALIALLSPAV
ncbi:hypothetical protein KSC_100930 [Ktedonobacter sp. SOSP1-52]|nr:hypothetical protein KSC_100930 [Ktedonobacter sp. SOSP1-52]